MSFSLALSSSDREDCLSRRKEEKIFVCDTRLNAHPSDQSASGWSYLRWEKKWRPSFFVLFLFSWSEHTSVARDLSRDSSKVSQIPFDHQERPGRYSCGISLVELFLSVLSRKCMFSPVWQEEKTSRIFIQCRQRTHYVKCPQFLANEKSGKTGACLYLSLLCEHIREIALMFSSFERRHHSCFSSCHWVMQVNAPCLPGAMLERRCLRLEVQTLKRHCRSQKGISKLQVCSSVLDRETMLSNHKVTSMKICQKCITTSIW